ncbi:MAG: polysaccharide deacetylase family protein [Clostridia bacterium]|nr:polysaccharide deacetylase family protein [Clostridia bacterium]
MRRKAKGYRILVLVTVFAIIISLIASLFYWVVPYMAVRSSSNRSPLGRTQLALVGQEAGQLGRSVLKSGRPKLPAGGQRWPVVVLAYHDLGLPEKGLTISVNRLQDQILALKRSGYCIISVSEMANYLEGKSSLSGPAVVLTFDDGYRSFYHSAFPLFRKLRVPATVFEISGSVGQNWNLTWRQLREMQASGLITIGAHTFSSHKLVPIGPGLSSPATVGRIFNPGTGQTETPSQYQARMLADSLACQQTFRERLGAPTQFFAYPYGAYNQDLIQILHQAGYRYLFSTLPGANYPGQNLDVIWRINAGSPNITPFRLLASIRHWSRRDRWAVHSAPASQVPVVVPLKVEPQPKAPGHAPLLSRRRLAMVSEARWW